MNVYSMDNYGYRYRYVINVNESNDWIMKFYSIFGLKWVSSVRLNPSIGLRFLTLKIVKKKIFEARWNVSIG